ncbi:interleukin-32 [Kogia breviceps]|uniref:interleukin-32 n=1 Tax=Kogia breviceps TaxID=27615 RepID=UPI0034D190BB
MGQGLSGPGHKLASPASAGRLSTTAPPGKPSPALKSVDLRGQQTAQLGLWLEELKVTAAEPGATMCFSKGVPDNIAALRVKMHECVDDFCDDLQSQPQADTQDQLSENLLEAVDSEVHNNVLV